MKTDLRNISIEELGTYLLAEGEKPFRARQIETWLWSKQISSLDQMTNIPEKLQQKLDKHFFISSQLSILDTKKSIDGTIKYVLETQDKSLIEMVLIPSETSTTVCVSSQVGCSLNCCFCATSKITKKRNLKASEIFDQVLLAINEAPKQYNKKLTNIVYMGMGEPLLNYTQVVLSINYITKNLGWSKQKITLSTSGIPKMIRKFADDSLGVNFAFSLHSAQPYIREEIMPFSKKMLLEDVVEALIYLYSKTKKRLTFEYIIWKNINDNPMAIKALIDLCKRIPSKVNLIEYNNVSGLPFEKAAYEDYLNYQRQLTKAGIICKIRHSRGKDIQAGCGQLALNL